MSDLKRLQKAVLKGMNAPESIVMRITYRDRAGAESTRVVSPIRFDDGGRSMLALCLAKEMPRKFVLEQIVAWEYVDANEVQMPMPMVTKGHPNRIQRSRAAGWRMPENAVYVGRPSKWGNPFATAQAFLKWIDTGEIDEVELLEDEKRLLPDSRKRLLGYRRQRILRDIDELAGKRVACWCDLSRACHGDVLATLADCAVQIGS